MTTKEYVIPPSNLSNHQCYVTLYDYLGHDSQFICLRIINMDGLRNNAYLHFVVQFNGNAENLH